MKRKTLTIFTALAISSSLLFGCGQAKTAEPAVQEETVSEEAGTQVQEADASAKENTSSAEATAAMAEETADGTATAAASAEEQPVVTAEDGAQHFANLKGTYVNLFDVILQEGYHSNWINSAAPIVGEDMAEDMVAMLQASVTGTLIGQEAVDAYTKDPDSMAFDCSFKQGVAKFVVEDRRITGLDAEGNELFSHEYEFVKYDPENGWYEYETADEDAGEFKYFLFGFDEPDLTWHIEFRYGSDLEQLETWMEGDYAYWMASGILEDNQEMAEKSIELFVTENLSEMEESQE